MVSSEGACAAYYKYGDRTELFEKALKGNHRTRQAIRDHIATHLTEQLGPVLRDSFRARPTLLDSSGTAMPHYGETASDVMRSDRFYEAVRDFVSQGAGALVDYRHLLRAIDQWRTWAHRLSGSIVGLLAVELVMIGACVSLRLFADPNQATRPIYIAASFTPMAFIICFLFLCLLAVHTRHGTIVDLREQYDPES
jgi:hypothetical protein